MSITISRARTRVKMIWTFFSFCHTPNDSSSCSSYIYSSLGLTSLKQGTFLSTHERHLQIGILQILAAFCKSSYKEAKHFKNIMYCHMCWRLPETDTNTVFNPVPPRQHDVPVDKKVACLCSIITRKAVQSLIREH